MTAAEPLPAALPGAHLPLSLVYPDPHQPRREFEETALAELAASIREFGVLQPITVRSILEPGGTGRVSHYVIIAGERRWRASKLAGLETIPAIVRDDISHDDLPVVQLLENLQRADLTLIEQARGCTELVRRMGLDEATQRLGMSKAWVSQRATLFGLPEAIVGLIESGHLTSVDMAHDLAALAEVDEDGEWEANRLLEEIGRGVHMPTREAVRALLRGAREAAEGERQRAQRIAATHADLFTAPAGDDDDDAPQGASASGAPKAPAKPREDRWQREARLRMEAWDKLMPEVRAIQRDARRAIIEALADVNPSSMGDDWRLSVTLPSTGTTPPALATGATFPIEIGGGTDDAGIVIEALDAKHTVPLSIQVTVAELRSVEKLLGRRLPVWATGTMGSSTIKLHGGQAAGLAAAIKRRFRAEYGSAEAEAPAAASGKGERATPESVASFLRACTQPSELGFIANAKLHAAYVAHCERHGLLPMSYQDNRWPIALREGGVEIKRRKDGRYCHGLRLLVEA